jgi:hypothetical protein
LWQFVYEYFVAVLSENLSNLQKFPQCSPKVSPDDVIFCSVLAANIAYYGSLPKTLNLTPPELMRNAGQ